MTKKYEDIIGLPRHVSKKHPPMAMIDRAAQFSPFAALTGHGAAVQETERLTDRRIEQDDYEREILGQKLQWLGERLKEQHEVTITYFQPDRIKEGGAYVTVTGAIKKIDEYRRILVMAEGSEICMDEVAEIRGSVFERWMDGQEDF